jgi:hypothetical protein
MSSVDGSRIASEICRSGALVDRETKSGAPQVLGAVAKADTDITALIRRSLDAIGRTESIELTAFTDRCPGLRRIFADAGVAETPILDWFHVGMRLQHLK